MIGFLSGKVLQINEKTVLLLTASGVGYLVFPVGSVLAQTKKWANLEVFTHTIVREQELSLYGFSTQDEVLFFEKLIGISGVGPKIALQILSTPINEFQAAVERGDADFIARTPGIGKKMAQKIIVELQGKLDLSSIDPTKNPQNPAKAEATQALKGLGYDDATIEFTLKDAPKDADTETLVKYFLSHG